MSTVDPNSPDHVILYAMLVHFSRNKDLGYIAEVSNPPTLCEMSYPVRFYGQQYVAGRMNEMKEQGVLKTVTIWNRDVGYTFSDEGLETVEELGVPKQYDH